MRQHVTRFTLFSTILVAQGCTDRATKAIEDFPAQSHADVGAPEQAVCDMIALRSGGKVDGARGLFRSFDFGAAVEAVRGHLAPLLFGVDAPLLASAPPTEGPVRSQDQSASELVHLADGLRATYLTREAGNKTDMMVLWPSDHEPTHLITCVEGDREVIGTMASGEPKYNPSIQAIDLATGAVSTLVRGMDRCDGIRRTPWQTVLATEETDLGFAFEIASPLSVSEATVLDRGEPGEPAVIDSPLVVKRSALPTMAWEGLTVLDGGVVIGGDELRPGTSAPDEDGGALFKFVPTAPHTGGAIADLSESPLVDGHTFALQVSCLEGEQQVGQGCEVGNGAWIEVDPSLARADANTVGATGYYRPEDLHRDKLYTDYEHPEAVRFCWTNTGRHTAGHYGEVVCGVDETPTLAAADVRSVVVNRFVEGDTDFNAFDNLAFQPVSGNLYVLEDNPNGDIFACLRDGADRDIKSDGCIKILSVVDSSAEPTGLLFSKDGRRAYLSIQHSDDAQMPTYDDYGTDDVIVIDGFDTRSF